MTVKFLVMITLDSFRENEGLVASYSFFFETETYV